MTGLKMTGSEYRAFTESEWGPGWYWDETVFLLNGEEVDDIGEVADTDKIVILAGTIYKGDMPNAPHIAAVPFARKWLKARGLTSLIVEVPNALADEVRGYLSAKGFRVVG